MSSRIWWTSPSATMRPLLITRMFEVSASTSCSTWLDTSTLRPAAAHVANQLNRPAALDRVHAVQRLVEDEQLGIERDGLRELDALPHALAVRADLLSAARRSGRRPRAHGRPPRTPRPSDSPFSRTRPVTHSRPVMRS